MNNYNFLKDKPTGKDLFESKSHELIQLLN